MKSNKIVIVGAGSSGWMVASFLIKTFPDRDVSVIESKDVPIVGVGESTLGDMTNFRDYLEIDELDFMKHTNASYKMSIKFTDFYRENSGGFHYPFGSPDLSDPDLTLDAWMRVKSVYPETPVQDFTRCFFGQSELYENNKFSGNKYGQFGVYNQQNDVAYHFDATMFGAWLRDRYCLPRGVKRIVGTVNKVLTDKDGVSGLIMDDGSTLTADLYVDCTGWKSLLLGEALQEPFIPYTDMLPNNRAWAVQVPYIDKEKEMEPFTNCTAIGHGWCWNIPLWSRLGTGYVYSDQFISPEEAKEEYKQYLMSDKMIIPRTKEQVDALKFNDVKMRVGIHERTWVKNVVAIGLAAGFIEPLESNGLISIQRFVNRLAKSLLRGTVTQWDRDVYNSAVFGIYHGFSEFVAMHYALSNRDDTNYWQAIAEKQFNPSMINLLPQKTLGFASLKEQKMFNGQYAPLDGITYISIGMNYPISDRVNQVYDNHGDWDKRYIDELVKRFNKRKEYWAEAAKNAPSLYEYLRDNVHNEENR